MISFDLISKGFDFVSGKGLDWFKAIVGEVDKHRLINYGELKVNDENHKKLKSLLSRGRDVRLDAESKGAFDDGYRRSGK